MKTYDVILEKVLVFYEDFLMHVFFILAILSPFTWQKIVFSVAFIWTFFCFVTRFKRVRNMKTEKPELKPPVQKVPATDENLYSACMYMRHDFGLLEDKEKELMLREGFMWANAFTKVIEDEQNK